MKIEPKIGQLYKVNKLFRFWDQTEYTIDEFNVYYENIPNYPELKKGSLLTILSIFKEEGREYFEFLFSEGKFITYKSNIKKLEEIVANE